MNNFFQIALKFFNLTNQKLSKNATERGNIVRVYLACVGGSNSCTPPWQLWGEGGAIKSFRHQFSIQTFIDPSQPRQVIQLPVFPLSNSYFCQVKPYKHSVLPTIYYTYKYTHLFYTVFLLCLFCLSKFAFIAKLTLLKHLPDVFQSFEKVEEFEKGSKN